MNLTAKELYLLKIIPRGRNRAMTYRKLKEKYQLDMTRRTFCDMIRRLREKGIAIGADRDPRGGYYLIETEEEREEAFKEYKAQANKEITIAYQFKRGLLAGELEEKLEGMKE
ncbi:hypothetical protein HZY86_01220 [Aerococcaceae bacterium DSM 111020]|nr:hypothetical protein [Aerococcaceae bacterium DSM 111020]